MFITGWKHPNRIIPLCQSACAKAMARQGLGGTNKKKENKRWHV